MKTLEEQILGAESQAAVSHAVQEAVERAKMRRREMVDQVNANQRLEGYEPDEQLRQLQERFIAGELETSQMIELLTEYGRECQTNV
jgi:ribosome assembly protein YihI (activator of Der GTPase)